MNISRRLGFVTLFVFMFRQNYAANTSFICTFAIFMVNKVSVCIPVFNGKGFLRQSLESVINQTYMDMEILIVDDGSTDGSIEVLEEFALRDARIRLVLNEENLGLVGNWNKCIELASGEWIKFQFQDDTMQENALEKMLNFAKEHEVRLVLTDREYIADSKSDSRTLRKYNKVKKLSYFVPETRIISADEMCEIANNDLFQYNFLGEPILGLIRKDIFESYGTFDYSFKQLVDFEFWLRISVNESIGFINEKLHVFRLHGDSQTTKNNNVRGVRPGLRDRVDLIDKVIKHEHYAFYREVTERTIPVPIADFFDDELSKLACNIGYYTYKRTFGSENLPKSLTGRTTRMYKALRTDFFKFIGRLPRE